MANMQKEGLKGECPYGFTQLSVRSQKMAVLLHRMKQLNELDHTEWSWKHKWDPFAVFETEEQTDARYARQKRATDDYNSHDAAYRRKQYEQTKGA